MVPIFLSSQRTASAPCLIRTARLLSFSRASSGLSDGFFDFVVVEADGPRTWPSFTATAGEDEVLASWLPCMLVSDQYRQLMVRLQIESDGLRSSCVRLRERRKLHLCVKLTEAETDGSALLATCADCSAPSWRLSAPQVVPA